MKDYKVRLNTRVNTEDAEILNDVLGEDFQNPEYISTPISSGHQLGQFLITFVVSSIAGGITYDFVKDKVLQLMSKFEKSHKSNRIEILLEIENEKRSIKISTGDMRFRDNGKSFPIKGDITLEQLFFLLEGKIHLDQKMIDEEGVEFDEIE